MSEFASTYGKCPMFVKMDGAKALRSFDELVSRFAPDNITSTIVKISGRPLISYWLDSYGRVCRDRETYPELFIYPNANSTVDDALRPDLFTDPCAASTMLPGKGVESVSLLRSLKLAEPEAFARLESVMNAIGLRFRMEVMCDVRAGTPLDVAIARISERFRWMFHQKIFGNEYDEMIESSIDQLRTIVGGLA